MLPVKNSIFARLQETANDEDLLRLRCDSQSLSFYSDISSYISRNICAVGRCSLLDVGPRSGAGLAFLRLAHHPESFSSLKLDPVHGIDLDPCFARISELEFPDIFSRTEDIFNIQSKSFDIVICSHTIEHLPDPVSFIKQLEFISRKYVVLAAPFEERIPLTNGHLVKFDGEFLDALGYTERIVYTSTQFHNGACFIASKEIN